MATFDLKSNEYDAWYETSLGSFVDARETESAMMLLPTDIGRNILDVGCGTGRFSLKLAMQGFQMTGVDICKPMLEIARQKASYAELDMSFHEMDVLSLNFPDNTFDAVVSMAMFEFIHEDNQALAECLRVVKPGGYVMVGTITRDSSWGKEYCSHMSRPESVFYQANFKTAEEMRSLRADLLVASNTSVFIPPNISDESLSLEEEARLSKFEVGAFVCLLWQKANKR